MRGWGGIGNPLSSPSYVSVNVYQAKYCLTSHQHEAKDKRFLLAKWVEDGQHGKVKDIQSH